MLTRIVGGVCIVAGGVYLATSGVNHWIPPEQKTEQLRGAEIMRSREGDVYVRGEPDDMMHYMINTYEPRELRHALDKVGKEMNYERK